MRHITKGKEPESLTRYRATAFASYDGYADKDVLREHLLRDQGYLCCYCMRRIWAHRMRIEHWEPQSAPPGVPRTPVEQREVELSYKNLFAACQGGERTKEERLEESARPKGFQYTAPGASKAKRPPHPYHHCDKLKGETPIVVSPADPSRNCEQLLRYLPDGEITSDDEAIRRDLDETLNLNLDVLKRNRKVVLDATLEYLRRKHPSGDWTAVLLQQEILRRKGFRSRAVEPDPAEIPPRPQQTAMVFDEYCQVAVYYLQKRLSRAKRPAD
jgi:uncharacterized protein (TIGR02646 family)